MSRAKESIDKNRFNALPPGARQVALDITSSPDKARQFLRANGFITAKGKLSKVYR